MMITNKGNIIIHQEIWNKIKKDHQYRKFVEDIEDIEDHFMAKLQAKPRKFEDFLKDLKNN